MVVLWLRRADRTRQEDAAGASQSGSRVTSTRCDRNCQPGIQAYLGTARLPGVRLLTENAVLSGARGTTTPRQRRRKGTTFVGLSVPVTIFSRRAPRATNACRFY